MKISSLRPSNWSNGLKARLIRYSEPFVSDRKYLEWEFKRRVGYPLNLDNPRTFNEKLQWLKLESKNHPEYTQMVDKVTAKDYVASIIGEEYIIPTFGVWNDVESIEFDALPNQFVIKSTGDSGGVVICKDKSKFDIASAKAKLKKRLGRNYSRLKKEFPYNNVKPRIIAEAYMEDESGELQDYKIHNFNGQPKFTLVCRNRFSSTGLTEDFYSYEWQLMDVKRPNHSHSDTIMAKPEELAEMYRLAEMLSKDIPFVRTDFYIVKHKVYFGELTFFPASGMGQFVPKEWDYKFGEMLDLHK